ncbi:TetR/AcrR family transcriptional regulator [Nocardioides pacificus]
MPKGPTPREVARAENIARIKELALTQLAESGATSLSLRAIARELNLVSSAIYRYYASRDELITALIVDAYDDLGEHLEAASSPSGRATQRRTRRRWHDVCHALRDWAVAQPHRFSLIYGSAIPGYAAPADTIAPAGRVLLALAGPAVLGAPPAAGTIPRTLRTQLHRMDDALDLQASPETLLLLTAAFARLIGVLTLELNGHLVGGFEPADALFATLVEREADALGL